jgi:hypothetical protein
MASTLEVVQAEALQLSTADRALLTDRLIASLGTDPAVEEAWAVEVGHRLAAAEDGSATWLPGPETLEKIKSVFR